MGKHGTGKALKICFKCNKEFYARVDRVGKFCSKSCSSASKPKRYLRQEKICAICNKSFIVKRYRLDSALYCSVDCRRKNMPSKENHINWKGGISERPYEVRKKIKEILSINGKCSECGSAKLLQGHHLKPYSEFPELGCDDNNIVILCSNCHALRHPEIGNFILKENKMSEKWIQKAVSKHPGKLHRELGVPQGKNIPAKKLKKAEHSKNPTIRREANLAKTLKKLKS